MRRLFGPLGLAALNHNPFCSRQPDGHLRKHCIGRPLLPARESRSLRWWNNRRLCGLWCALALLSALPLASAAETLTLEQAVRFAEAHSAALRSAEAELDAAQGALADARALLWNNPELAAEGRRRKAPQLAGRGDANGEWGAGLSQTFEIAGQQGHRRAAAEQALAAAQEMVAATRRALRAEVERRFVRLLTLEQRIALEERLLQVFEKTATAIARRVQVGENNRLEGNLARIEQERVGNQLSALAEQRSAAQGELASLLQWPGADLPMVSGTLERPASHALAGLLDAAQASAAMRALAHREEAARSRLDLEQAALYPDVTVGLGFSSEGPPQPRRERITTLSLSVPLPLFRRNATAIGQAASAFNQARIEHLAAGRDAQVAVRTLWQRLQSLDGRVRRLSAHVLPMLEENRRLSSKAFAAGEIDLVQLMMVNRQLFDGQIDLLDAQSEQRLTLIDLEAAAGWPAQEDPPADLQQGVRP